MRSLKKSHKCLNQIRIIELCKITLRARPAHEWFAYSKLSHAGCALHETTERHLEVPSRTGAVAAVLERHGLTCTIHEGSRMLPIRGRCAAPPAARTKRRAMVRAKGKRGAATGWQGRDRLSAKQHPANPRKTLSVDNIWAITVNRPGS